jgi:hypothetical protein
VAALEKLGGELGAEHDLALLEHFIQKQLEPGPETDSVLELIQVRRRQLRANIRRLGRRVYTATTEEVGDQVEADWKKWRKS